MGTRTLKEEEIVWKGYCDYTPGYPIPEDANPLYVIGWNLGKEDYEETFGEEE